jgi:hypothetical protein
MKQVIHYSESEARDFFERLATYRFTGTGRVGTATTSGGTGTRSGTRCTTPPASPSPGPSGTSSSAPGRRPTG